MALKAPPYGRDTRCTTHLRPGRLVSGGELLAEALFRRFTTRRGTLLYAGDYGLLVSDLINSEMTDSEIEMIPGKLRQEGLKDKRIARLDIAKTVDRTGPFLSLTIDIQGLGKNGETFALVLEASQVSTKILRIGGSYGG